jgi:hypothetical protein
MMPGVTTLQQRAAQQGVASDKRPSVARYAGSLRRLRLNAGSFGRRWHPRGRRRNPMRDVRSVSDALLRATHARDRDSILDRRSGRRCAPDDHNFTARAPTGGAHDAGPTLPAARLFMVEA